MNIEPNPSTYDPNCSQCHGTGKLMGTPYDPPFECDCWDRQPEQPTTKGGTDSICIGLPRLSTPTPEMKPTGPANLPEGHEAYPVVIGPDGVLSVGWGGTFTWVSDCHNGLRWNSLYLYGWCEDDATFWRTTAIRERFTAKWALFRPVG